MYEYRVKSIDRIIDGDTVDVTIDLGFSLYFKERVRVAGVDTPEVRTRNLREKQLGFDASEFVEDWFAEVGELVIRTDKDDKYGRTLGYFYRGEECLNDRIVEEGWGWAYGGGTKYDADNEEHLLMLLNKRGYETWEEYSEANQ